MRLSLLYHLSSVACISFAAIILLGSSLSSLTNWHRLLIDIPLRRNAPQEDPMTSWHNQDSWSKYKPHTGTVISSDRLPARDSQEVTSDNSALQSLRSKEAYLRRHQEYIDEIFSHHEHIQLCNDITSAQERAAHYKQLRQKIDDYARKTDSIQTQRILRYAH